MVQAGSSHLLSLPLLHSASLPGDDGGCSGAAAAAAAAAAEAAAGQLASRWKGRLGGQPARTVRGVPGLGALRSAQHDAVTGNTYTQTADLYHYTVHTRLL